MTGDWIARFEPRTLTDVRAIVQPDPENERRFAAVRRVSEINLGLYRTLLQPFVQAAINEQGAQWLHKLNPAELPFEIFSERNPLMQQVAQLAEQVREQRQPVAPDNPLLQWQQTMSQAIVAALDGYRDLRDSSLEKIFLALYGSPVLQAMLGLSASDEPPRKSPGHRPGARRLDPAAHRRAQGASGRGRRRARRRSAPWSTSAWPGRASTSARSTNCARSAPRTRALTLQAFKQMLREQYFSLMLDRDAALAGDPEDAAARRRGPQAHSWRPSIAPSKPPVAEPSGERARSGWRRSKKHRSDAGPPRPQPGQGSGARRPRAGAESPRAPALGRRARSGSSTVERSLHAASKHEKYERLIERCKALRPTPCAVAHPCDESSLRGAVEAAQMGLLKPILVGPKARIEARGRASSASTSSGCELVDAPHSEASAETAVRLVREGKAEMLMKGSLHTDELMAAVVKRETGLRTGRRVSHCFVMDVPAIDRVVIITDAAVNIFPTLEDKVHIVQNAIDLAHALGHGAAQGGDPVGDGDGQPAGAVDDRGRAPCARWPSAARSPAASSTARWRSTTRSTWARPRSRRSPRRWPGAPTSWWCPTSRPATCWPRA